MDIPGLSTASLNYSVPHICTYLPPSLLLHHLFPFSLSPFSFSLFCVLSSPTGLLSNWFKRHLSLLQAVLPMILQSLMQPELASCAALAFKDVCGDCANELSTVATQLIPHCQVSAQPPPSHHTLLTNITYAHALMYTLHHTHLTLAYHMYTHIHTHTSHTSNSKVSPALI